MARDPASFRDPAGQVHLRDGRVFRSVLPAGLPQYLAAKQSGFVEVAVRNGLLIEGRELDPQLLAEEAPGAVHLIEHPRLEFISYPYEWSFAGLKAAALLTIALHLEAQSYGLTLSDASAYNIQFVGSRPLCIDYLSLIPYQPGQVWLGYRQFCEQLLNPLLLSAKTGVAFQPWYRGTLEGVSAGDLAALLPFRAKLDPRIAAHVVLQGRLQRTVTARRTSAARRIRLSASAYRNNLLAMRGWVARLTPPASQRTPWERYEQCEHYTAEERARKAAFVAEVVRAVAPRQVWDLGCNSGAYSEIALQNGAGTVIGFEPDPGALNAAFNRASAKRLAFLPLALDVANPTPSLGWRQSERAGIAERRGADLVLCLALMHHLVLARSLPLAEVIDWITSLAPRGILEFVPKEDPMARQLLALKPDTAPDYTRTDVERLLCGVARIERQAEVTTSGRVLYAFVRA